ncbi:MAG: hypothetical protein QOF35_1076 [Actinomycetota bacterium]|jgi:hypothetical protein|nr:hypothetical protein [Actinomycetota bacterium]
MAQQTSSPHDLPPDFEPHVGLSSKGRLWNHVTREVLALEVEGQLSDVVEDLDWKIQLALAESPRGLVCDLSDQPAIAQPEAVEMLARAGRHVRDWPAVPIAVSCPDLRVREALRAHPIGGHLIVTGSRRTAVSAVVATPTLNVERLRLAPNLSAPGESRKFVAGVLLDWGLGELILCASLMVEELVTSSTIDAGTDIDVSVAWNLGALRLTVRDHGPAVPPRSASVLSLPRHASGRGRSPVAALSRAHGVLPTADGGKVVWAVINAAQRRLRPLSTSSRPQEVASAQDPAGPGQRPPRTGARSRRPPHRKVRQVTVLQGTAGP